MATSGPTDKPTHPVADTAPTSTEDAPQSPRERSQRGHIGLIVGGSILAGLALGLVLVLGVFGGGEEATITGSALLALGAGMLLLFCSPGAAPISLSPGRSSQPSSLAVSASRF
jgi:predicted lipid-binding transport protein (Tim44 family)